MRQRGYFEQHEGHGLRATEGQRGGEEGPGAKSTQEASEDKSSPVETSTRRQWWGLPGGRD